MSRRGSAQLLLLFFRSQRALEWSLGMIGGVLLLAGLVQAVSDFSLLTWAGPVQLLRQSAWQHALAGLPEQAAWPWTDASPGGASTVPRLGLSASILKEQPSSQDETRDSKPNAGETAHAQRQDLAEVGDGDRITVTSSNGVTRIYRVTGRKVVDPHLADTETRPLDGDATLVTCLPLDPLLASSLRLIIQATKVDIEPPAPRPEQKL
jgi:sortase family protein